MDILILLFLITVIIVSRSITLGETASGGKFKRSIEGELKSEDVIYDLQIPLIFFTIVVILSIIYAYTKPAIYFDRKEIREIVGFVCSFISRHDNLVINNCEIIKFSEVYREYLIVIGAYFIILFTRAIKNNKIQYDNNHWDEYDKALKKARHVRALNLSSVEEFFEPIGFRYFLGQIIERNNRRDDKQLEILRVVIISDGETYRESWIKNYSPASTHMNKEYRVFHNFVELHKLHGIKLYFATKNEVNNYINQYIKDGKNSCPEFSLKEITEKKIGFCKRCSIKIYYLLCVIPIIPLFGIFKDLLDAIKNIKSDKKTKRKSQLYFEELDLLCIDDDYFFPEKLRNRIIFKRIENSDRTKLANEIIQHFSGDGDREASKLFFSYK